MTESKRYFRKALASSMMKRSATTVVCSVEAQKRWAHHDFKAAHGVTLTRCDIAPTAVLPQGSWSHPGCHF